MTAHTEGALTLVTRRVIRATPERLFEAWTTPEQLKAWWGPRGVRCVGAEVDLRVGGGYRIANGMEDGRVITIRGVFEIVERPSRLVYSWLVEPGGSNTERVTVRFEQREEGTEVIVLHERIAEEAVRAGHEQGWLGCLEGLWGYVEEP